MMSFHGRRASADEVVIGQGHHSPARSGSTPVAGAPAAIVAAAMRPIVGRVAAMRLRSRRTLVVHLPREA